MELVLSKGYKDKQGVVHRDVTFGKRYTGATLLAIDTDPQGDIPTQFKLLVARATITKFGTLPMPVPLDVLLKLNRLEITALMNAHNKFMQESLSGRKNEYTSDSEMVLAFGYEDNGRTYNRVRFGTYLNGYDEIAADQNGYQGLHREYFLIGRQITSLSTLDGEHKLDGPFELEMFKQLDAEDFIGLGVAATIWQESFRGEGDALQANAERPGDDAGEPLQVVGRADSVAANSEA